MTDTGADQFLECPVFISGHNRSGTTLLLSLLDNHPELVVIPEELHYFRRVLFNNNKEAAIRRDSGFRDFLPNPPARTWSRGKPWYRPGYPEFDSVAFEGLVKPLLQHARHPKYLLLQLVNAFAIVAGQASPARKAWVSKTPLEEMFFPVMWAMFGRDCRFLYIVRDPRDVYLSVVKRKAIRRSSGQTRVRLAERLLGVVNFAVVWQTEVRYALQCQRRYPNFHVVRYEDLVLNTAATLRQLGQWLGIEASASLHQPTRHGQPWEGHSVISGNYAGVSAEAVGRFAEGLNARTRVTLEHCLQKEMAALDYANFENSRIAFPHWISTDLAYWLYRAYFIVRYWSVQQSAIIRYQLESRRTGDALQSS